jgi:predicted nucleic acid-binding protein
MGMKALFDSDVLIDYLLGHAKARTELQKYAGRLISVVSWAEVMIGAHDEEEKRRCRDFLASFTIIPCDQTIAEEAVRLRQTHHLKLPDAIIWATARISEALLVTRNPKDFPHRDPFVRFPYKI